MKKEARFTWNGEEGLWMDGNGSMKEGQKNGKGVDWINYRKQDLELAI